MKLSRTLTNLMIMVFITTFITSMALGATPQIINYQGFLTNTGGEPLDTSVSIVFSIYSDSTSVSPIWTETQPNVMISGGIFNVLLGSIVELPSTVFNDIPRFLGVKVGVDNELTPRIRITASPYSYKAGSVEGFSPGPNNTEDGLFIFLGGDSNRVSSDYSTIAGGKGNIIEAFNFADTTLDTTDVLNPNPLNMSFEGRSTGFGAFIGGGWYNHAHGIFSVLTGGLYNTSWCAFSSLVGGYNNFAGGHFSFLGGGYRNAIGSDSLCNCGYASVLNGGYLNINDGYYATLGGGFGNRIFCSSGNTIAGGMRNISTSNYSTVGGGMGNSAGGDGATIGGGYLNYVQAMYGTVSGGGPSIPSDPNTNNEVYDNYGTVGGGGNNKAGSNDGIEINAEYTTIGGGHGNKVQTSYATIGGGNNNNIVGNYATISGGDTNYVGGDYSTIGGGFGNEAIAVYATIAGGEYNQAPFNDHQFIGGGAHNYAPDPYATISGGLDNQAYTWATVGGGVGNLSHNEYTFIGGGSGNQTLGHANVIGGGLNNRTQNRTSVVCGGEQNGASANDAFVGGGFNNNAAGDTSVVAGGADNLAGLIAATVSGGSKNAATASYATISGGHGHQAYGSYGAIGGGFENLVGQGQYATVPGGYRNIATGTSSFAAGNVARAVDECSYVWADCCIDATGTTDLPLYSSGINTFNARATGGFYFFSSCDTIFDATNPPAGVHLPSGGSMWLAGSSRDLKENIMLVNGSDLLEDISSLPIYRWNYKDQDESVQHIGPMAQDFYSIFSIGDNDKTIAALDPAGISLAAIKELYKMNKELKNRIDEIDDLKNQVAKLQAENIEIKHLKQELAQLSSLVNILLTSKDKQTSSKIELAENK